MIAIEGLTGSLAKPLLLSFTALMVAVATVMPRVETASPLRDLVLTHVFASARRAVEFAGLSILLGLLVAIVRHFEIESGTFQSKLMPLVFFGFLIHYFLPLRLRKEFFLLLSLAAFTSILGLSNTLWLLVIGTALVGVCFLPLRVSFRVALLLSAAILLVFSRSGWLPAPWSGAFWPILGSLFMFRLIVFLYDFEHLPSKPKRATIFSYFFLLPNVVFPLFPIVDFSTFRRTYFNADHHVIYFRGIRWITWGVVHLIIFRILNNHILVAPEAVGNATDLLLYLVPNFLLLVQVSGKFHIITGILMLFGFNLPRTFRLFFLSPSFSAFWRRANTYWRDFMVKVFYYPCYFWLRGSGATVRLALATGFVFFVTWFLHAYQWYWLRGTVLFTLPDVAFWGLFGLLVLANSLYETKFGGTRVVNDTSASLRQRLMLSLRTVGVFFTVAILYSLWTSHSLAEWLSIWQKAFHGPLELKALLLLGITVGVIAIGAQIALRQEKTLTLEKSGSSGSFGQVVQSCALVLILFLVSTPLVRAQLGESSTDWLDSLKGSSLSRREADLLLRGYYENLTGVNHFNTELWELYSQKPEDWPLLQETEAARLTDDIFGIELVPSAQILFHGATLSINRWGMRDRDYDLAPPEGTYRVALLGPSFVMGSGVADEEVFDSVLEARLNSSGFSFEVLNFGIPSFSVLQELATLEKRALSFSPSALFLVAHGYEESILIRNLAGRVSAGVQIPYPFLNQVMEGAGVSSEMTRDQIEQALRPFGNEILQWIYDRIVAIASEKNILPFWVYVPTLETGSPQKADTELKQAAIQAGFRVFDLSDVYEGQAFPSLVVAAWDRHPNARAHRLIADRLFQEILNSGEFAEALDSSRAFQTE